MSAFFEIFKDRPAKDLFPGVRTRTAWLDRLMFSLVELEAGASVPMHQHPHEQMGMVLSGTLRFHIGDEIRVLKSGECYKIPSGVPHSATAVGELTTVLDVFSPVREEYK